MARKKGTKSVALFYIFAEGEATEKLYFENNCFGAPQRTDRKRPIINKGHRKGQDPNSIMEWVENTLDLRSKSRDIIWIVIDKDDNSEEELARLKKWCDEYSYNLAFSNPMFEYWFILHFQYMDSSVNKEYLYDCLDKNLNCKYKNKKNECHNEILSPLTDDAIKNAENLRKKIGEDCFENNPFTNVDRLVEDIRKYLRSG